MALWPVFSIDSPARPSVRAASTIYPRVAKVRRSHRLPAFLAAVKRGAVPIWMPRLLPAQQVEIRRLQFRDAAAGETGQGRTPLGPFDRARVLNWLQAMDASFAGIKTWLP